MRTIVMLFTRDLRVHDNPALANACQHADAVVPLFVFDPGQGYPPNRTRFLVDCLKDLRATLRKKGGDLLVRKGETVATVLKVAEETGADGIGLADDYGEQARDWRDRLCEQGEAVGVPVRLFGGVTVVEPGQLTPSTGGDHYKVFTPYWRAWASTKWRSGHDIPEKISLPSGVSGDDPAAVIGEVTDTSPTLPRGGESRALKLWDDWLDREVAYADIHDDLAADDTTRLSPYLQFGCVSPLAMATEDRAPEALVRQVCWRDFYHQVLAAFPQLATKNYRPGANDEWADDAEALEAWRHGRTGVELVDAGMRELLATGWMHNRARMVAASYLTKDLGVDWREGAAWFDRWLVDGDIANNYGNWQWTAGTGNDSKPYRKFNPDRQAARFDPEGRYRARWLKKGS